MRPACIVSRGNGKGWPMFLRIAMAAAAAVWVLALSNMAAIADTNSTQPKAPPQCTLTEAVRTITTQSVPNLAYGACNTCEGKSCSLRVVATEPRASNFHFWSDLEKCPTVEDVGVPTSLGFLYSSPPPVVLEQDICQYLVTGTNCQSASAAKYYEPECISQPGAQSSNSAGQDVRQCNLVNIGPLVFVDEKNALRAVTTNMSYAIVVQRLKQRMVTVHASLSGGESFMMKEDDPTLYRSNGSKNQFDRPSAGKSIWVYRYKVASVQPESNGSPTFIMPIKLDLTCPQNGEQNELKWSWSWDSGTPKTHADSLCQPVAPNAPSLPVRLPDSDLFEVTQCKLP
jgi:hypothetical protein